MDVATVQIQLPTDVVPGTADAIPDVAVILIPVDAIPAEATPVAAIPGTTPPTLPTPPTHPADVAAATITGRSGTTVSKWATAKDLTQAVTAAITAVIMQATTPVITRGTV